VPRMRSAARARWRAGDFSQFPGQNTMRHRFVNARRGASVIDSTMNIFVRRSAIKVH